MVNCMCGYWGRRCNCMVKSFEPYWSVYVCVCFYLSWHMGIACIVSTSVKMSSGMFSGSLNLHLLVKACLSGLAQSQSVWGDCRWHICSKVCIVSWLIQQSAILRNWRRLRKVRWHIMAVKRVSIMVCLVKHSQAHFHRLSPQAADLPVSFIAFSHEWEICLLKIPLCAVQYIHLCITLEWLMCVLAIVSILGTRALQG